MNLGMKVFIPKLHSIVPTAILAYFLYRINYAENFHSFCLSNYEYIDISESLFLTQNSNSTSHCPILPKADDKSRAALRNLGDTAHNLYNLPSPGQNGSSSSNTEMLQQLIFNRYGYPSAWEPDCEAVHKVNILVPYRNRLEQLNEMTTYLHPFLQMQKVAYRIIVVEQVDDLPFNKGAMLNAAFLESRKRFPAPCIVLQDVDVLPLNLENVYGCLDKPRHISASVNSYRYHLPYLELLCGIVSVTQAQFEEVNGFSNLYFGWGGEDDDFRKRLVSKGHQFVRFDPVISLSRMLPHVKAEPNPRLLDLYSKAEQRFDADGLNSHEYDLVSLTDGPSFTYIQTKLRRDSAK